VALAQLDEQSGGDMGMNSGKLWSASHDAKREEMWGNPQSLHDTTGQRQSDGNMVQHAGERAVGNECRGARVLALKCWAHSRVASGPI
jgi:hypothetical protein